MPEVSGGAVLHLRPDGYRLIPVQISDEIYEVFQSLLVVAHWDAEMKKGVIVTDANKTDPRKYYNRQVEAANKLCPPESMVPHSDQYLSDLKANTPPEGSVADSYRLSLFDYDTYEV